MNYRYAIISAWLIDNQKHIVNEDTNLLQIMRCGGLEIGDTVWKLLEPVENVTDLLGIDIEQAQPIISNITIK